MVLAMAGIVFIQFYWISNARLLHEDQFDNKVKLALKSTVNEIYALSTDTCGNSLLCDQRCIRKIDFDSLAINVATLDSLLRSEFLDIGITEPFVYGVFHRDALEAKYVSDKKFVTELLKNSHTASLSCIFRHDSLMLGVWFPGENKFAMRGLIWWLTTCFILLGVLATGLIISIYMFLKQRQISEMKTDFINNITHEFKTPIATISLASEMLHKPSVIANEEKAKKYAGIIYDENSRLKTQVEQVLQLAVLDKGSYELKYTTFDVHQLIEKVAISFRMIIKERNGTLCTSLKAKNHNIRADVMHIENVFNNLLDNAYKYSPQKPHINVNTSNNGDYIVISVSDNGIGISKDDQKHIFRKLFRVHTGNIHNVKGNGLGLYYVKTMVEAHNGHISVKSDPGFGSTFEISLPVDSINPVSPLNGYSDENKDITG